MNAQTVLSLDFQKPRAFLCRAKPTQSNGLSIRFKSRMPLTAQANLNRELCHYVSEYHKYVKSGYSHGGDNFKIAASVLSMVHGFLSALLSGGLIDLAEDTRLKDLFNYEHPTD